NLPTDQNPAFNAEAEVENINTAEAVEAKEREDFPKTEDDNNPLNDILRLNWVIRMDQSAKLFSQKDSKRNLYMWPVIAEHIDICGIYSSDGVNFYCVGKDQATNLYYSWSVCETEDPMDILSKDAWSEVRIFKVEGETSVPAKALNTVGRLVKMEEK
ncbi:MAG: hypothetical protein Q4D33_07660, partial [Prevotellaceae bacterium]|nr:hypothetical protein [Prevotellaceae bacterium]